MDHQHTLQLNDSGVAYMCSGCKDIGFGSSYNCGNSNCNYILHEECAKPITHASHPFFKNCTFRFYDKVPGDGFCDACGKDVLGFIYLCSQTGYALHPCCLNMPNKVFGKDGSVIMTLCHEVPSDCVYCKQRTVVRNQFKGWSYITSNGNCIHVSCLEDMILEKMIKKCCRSRGRMRSFIKFTGKLAIDVLIGAVTGDFSSIVETLVSSFSEC